MRFLTTTTIIILQLVLLSSCCRERWSLALSEAGKENWNKQWFLEGEKATVRNSEKGMIFSAGNKANDHANHAVLWSKEKFAGDIKVEYDYTRLDSNMDVTAVNIIYIQASGFGSENSPEDIWESTHLRKVPWMKSYFLNMNTLHISYACTGPKRSNYISARQYPAKDVKSFQKKTLVPPVYEKIDLFKPGETWHITVIKEANNLTFIAEREGNRHVFKWDVKSLPTIREGRVGFRHMWTRSGCYQNIKIFVKS